MPVQSVVTKLVEQKITSKNVEVISAVTKTLEDKVQTTIVTRSPETPDQNTVLIALVDKKTQEVTLVGEKTVYVSDIKEEVTV